MLRKKKVGCCPATKNGKRNVEKQKGGHKVPIAFQEINQKVAESQKLTLPPHRRHAVSYERKRSLVAVRDRKMHRNVSHSRSVDESVVHAGAGADEFPTVSGTAIKAASKPKSVKKNIRPEEVLLFSKLEKLRTNLSCAATDDSEDAIKSSTAKILGILRATDVDVAMDAGLPFLLTALKRTQDVDTVKNVVLILQTYLALKQANTLGSSMSVLLSSDVTGALLHSLRVLKQSSENDAVVLDTYALLAQFVSKDLEFPVKAKKSDTMKVGVNLLKKNFSRFPVIKPILQVIKSAAVSPPSSYCLGKECIYTLLCLLDSVERSQTGAMKLILDTLYQLLKCNLNRKEMVVRSGVPKLLLVLDQWERLEGVSKIRILRCTLLCLVNITDSKIGRTAVIEAEGISLLYRFCHNLPLSTDYDGVVSQASYVILKCLPPKWLPLDSHFSAVTFDIPEKADEFHKNANRAKEIRNLCTCNSTEEMYTCNSDDDEIETDECEDRECCFPLHTVPEDLSEEEIKFYKQFLPELESDAFVSSTDTFSRPLQNPSETAEDGSVRFDFPAGGHEVLAQQLLDGAGSVGELSHSDLHSFLSCVGLLKSDRGSGDTVSAHHPNCSDGDDSSCHTCRTFRNSRFCEDIRRSMMERQQIENFLQLFDFEESYTKNARDTKHVVLFVKLAYPDAHADHFSRHLEPLQQKDLVVSRAKLLLNLDRVLGKDNTAPKIVYDYDALVAESSPSACETELTNDDISRLGKPEEPLNCLKFESRFECGNLRKAIMIGPHSYELILNPDVNSDHHHQWFYFEVRNMEANVPYLFYIANCEKGTSQLGNGMKPVMYSVKEAVLGRPGWTRCGTNICYFRNQYSCLPGSKGRTYFTAHFSLVFQHSYDVCYLAYHYPYSYTLLKNHLQLWDSCHNRNYVFYRRQVLCHTLGGNDVPLLTITSASLSNASKRPVIVLSGRVHPGETNSSWIMKGTIDYLLSDKPSAEALRENAIFKLVPMLNPDGVINGCHRCSLSAEDLNRCWMSPLANVQPSVYHTKALILCLKQLGKLPLMFCDYHGHSRRKNVFLFGCNGQYSWFLGDQQKKDNSDCSEMFAKLLSHLAPAFSFPNCNFAVEKNREGTARVTLWRQMGVMYSYTMESTYCGCDQGPYKDFHLGIPQLLEMGAKFCHGIHHLQEKLKSLPAAVQNAN